jgi:hypothetical protein
VGGEGGGLLKEGGWRGCMVVEIGPGI